MVKSYQRFEQKCVFGVVSSNTNCVWIPSTSEKHSPGEVITGALENVNHWNIKTGELLNILSDGLPPGAVDVKLSKPAQSTYLDFHHDTNLLAVGYSDGMIKIWDLTSKIVVINLNGHKSGVSILKFDPTGTRLLSGSRDSTIIVWDLVGEVGLYKLRSHKDLITGIWCDNEEWLISTSKDGLIKIWDLKTQQCVETHIAHTGECWGLGIYNDLVVTMSSEAQIKIWHLNLERENGKKLEEKGIYEKQSKQRGVSIQFMMNQDHMGFFFVQNSDKTLEVFRIRTQNEISKAIDKRRKRLQDKGMSDSEIQNSIESSYVNMIIHPFQVIRSSFKLKSSSWAVSTLSKLELVVTTSNNTVEYYSIPYKKKVPSQSNASRVYIIELPGHRTDIRTLDISDDNKLLATASNGTLKIWNIKTQKCIRTFDCGYALTCKFLPGGSLVVIGTRAGELQLFDLASSTLLENKEDAHDAAIWSLDLTSDGKRLITGSTDKSVKFWDLEVEHQSVPGTSDISVPKLRMLHHTTLELGEEVLALKVSPDDKFLAISLLDNTVKVFFLHSMKFFLSLYGHKLPVLSMDISFDSKLIITSSADKNIKIWGLDFGDCHKSLFAHQDSIMNTKFVPESHNFFSCSKDGLVKYWDGDKFECIQKLSAHQSEVWALAISSNGQFIISTSHDHSIRVWHETEDQVFLEEEKEKELDEQYESTLLNSLDSESRDNKFDVNNSGEEITDETTEVHKQTMDSLKAGERLIEALDIGIMEIEENEEYEKKLRLWKDKKAEEIPVKPQGNSILIALGKTPQQYIMDTLIKIKPSQLEDALLVLPFSYILKLLKFIDVIIKDEKLFNNHLTLICKNLFFIIKMNHKELVSQNNHDLKLRITRVKEQLRKSLQNNVDNLGFNIQGLSFLRQQWNLRHNSEFVDDHDHEIQQEKFAKKRIFEKVV